MYRLEKIRKEGTDIVIDGFERGIAVSPYKGIANIQGANISTETGEIMCSFGRIKQSQTGTTGTLTQVNTNTVSVGGITLLPGQVITVTSDGGTGLYVPFTPLTSVSVLVVGGGGGGGNGSGGNAGGGGGAGGIITDTTHSVSSTAYTVTVGGGGAANTSGSNSVFDSLTGTGGGHGGTNASGTNGGSGGGAAQGTGHTGGTSTQVGGFGNAGGSSSNIVEAAGGGGAGGNGGGGGSSNGGAGGVGISNSISGASVFYGGGGGGASSTSGGAGGNGGGGAGASSSGASGVNGTANTGGGGGGGGASGTGGTGAIGVVVISYPTSTSAQATGGTITTSGGKTIHTFTTGGTFTVLNTTPIGPYYYYLGNGKLYGGTPTTGQLPPSDPDNAVPFTGITSGTATFSVTYPLGQPFQSATEVYRDSTNTIQYRYYILDSLGSVWCHDTKQLVNYPTPNWFFVGNAGAGASGLAVLNGWIFVTNGPSTYVKMTVLFGTSFTNLAGTYGLYSTSTRVSLVGHQGAMYISDGNLISSFFPDTSLISGFANIQSYLRYTAVTTTGTVVDLIGGSNPSTGNSSQRVPAIFFTDGTLPSTITASTIYYIEYLPGPPANFKVYPNPSGGSALNIQSGATGNQYINTFDPSSGPGQSMIIFTPQRLNLPFYETVTSMSEVGNLVIIGGTGNILYPWNQIDALPSDLINLPENYTTNLITVNNMVYAFVGNKGNIYITNGSAASAVISVPDYCAGIDGSPSTYVEPYFSWGGAMYLRGRVYFSIQDQTTTKAGNCGGIWSFIPNQNTFFGQDTGLALRIENQSSYGTYSGASSVLLPSQQQNAIGPQYWAGWYSSSTSPTYGIDFTNTVPQQVIFETDLIPTGTMLENQTFGQIEYKLSTPLVSGESIQIYYRQNSTDTYVSCGVVNVETVTDLSGYFSANFQSGQWLQLRIIMTPIASVSSSFCRLREIRVRQ